MLGLLASFLAWLTEGSLIMSMTELREGDWDKAPRWQDCLRQYQSCYNQSLQPDQRKPMAWSNSQGPQSDSPNKRPSLHTLITVHTHNCLINTQKWEFSSRNWGFWILAKTILRTQCLEVSSFTPDVCEQFAQKTILFPGIRKCNLKLPSLKVCLLLAVGFIALASDYILISGGQAALIKAICQGSHPCSPWHAGVSGRIELAWWGHV